jgi:ribonucleoside-triphosphate reductase
MKIASVVIEDEDYAYGCNPCSEIILRPQSFCNLSDVVIRAGDTLENLKEKVRIATILGTLQCTLTDFRYLRPSWRKNAEEERLLGVSMSGIMDHKVLGKVSPEAKLWLTTLKEVVIETNRLWAERLGVNVGAALTCVKPSGTVSQLVNAASGIHPRFAPYYIRTVRSDSKDPLAQYMASAGFPHESDITNSSNLVFSFPVKSPRGATHTKEVGAIGQLELWKQYQDYWCEHKPSITVYYTEDEFFDVCAWTWKNFDMVSGISLLPHSDHVYQQAPYQEISPEAYQSLLGVMPEFDWEQAALFERGVDLTEGAREMACVGTSCEWTGA